MFRWRKGDQAAICMIVARMTCYGMTFEQALRETLPLHSDNPSEIPEREVMRIRFQVENVGKMEPATLAG